MSSLIRPARALRSLAYLSAVALLAAATLAAPAAHGQDWPAKPVRVVVPFSAGGTTDISARLVAEHLSKAFKQNFVVENKPGAGGNIGAAEVANAAPDGYTIVMNTPGPAAINQFLFRQMPFEQGALVPVSFVVRVPNVLMVNPAEVKSRNLEAFLKEVKANPGKFSYGSPGNGSTGHLSTELLKASAGGLQIAHVPYKGSAPMLLDLVGGNIQMAIDNMPAAMGQIKAGKVIPLGVTSSGKSSTLPDVPPISSLVPGYEAESWFVLMAPKGTPAVIIDKLSAEVDRILKKPEVIERFKSLGAEPVGGTPESLGKFIAAETTKWEKVVKESGAKID